MILVFLNNDIMSRLLFCVVQELGLLSGTPVGSSLIDAHAGGVGVMKSLPLSKSQLDGKTVRFQYLHLC